jgi:ubiquinone/menaquinone biosynthesis C-methylase UbiE
MYKKLTELGLKTGTDKAYYHLFTEFYNDYFENFLCRPINILEIGIASGKSILMLREFFPNASIYAIDINEESVNLDLGDNVHKYLCSQDDFANLSNLFSETKFDIIIEDGSHFTSHQQTSLGFFFQYLNAGGIYICEDLHTSYRTSHIDSSITTMQMIENYKLFGTFKSNLLTNEQLEYLHTNVSDLKLYERSENALLCYHCFQLNVLRGDNCASCGTLLSPLDRSITSIFFHA